MKKITYLISLLLFITLSIFISNCTVDHLYTKDEFMALGEESDNSDNNNNNNNNNTELKEAQLVNPTTEDNGFYTFSSVSIRKSNGELMFDGIDFNYNQPLNSIYNSADNGSLSNGYFRVVHNGINVINGLGLTPVAKDLSVPVNPSSGQVYIDPEYGRFVLPRPAYWSKCEDINNLIDANILNEDNLPYYSSTASQNLKGSGKFGSGIQWNMANNQEVLLYPVGQFSSLDQATISFWFWQQNFDPRHAQFHLWNQGNFIQFDSIKGNQQNCIYIAGIYSTYDNSSIDGGFHHVYIVWDKNGNLEDNKTCRVYIDNVERISSTTKWTSSIGNLYFWFKNATDSEEDTTRWIDNIQVWDYIVSEDADWLYNSSNGREEAFHIIYGQTNNYKPIIQVGYFYK